MQKHNFLDYCELQDLVWFDNKDMICLDWFPCPNVGQASTNRDLRLYPGGGGLFFLYCDKFSSFSHLKSRLLTTGL